MFSRDFRRPKGAKFKIYLIFESCRASVVALSLWRRWCPPIAGGQGTLAILLTLAKMDKIHSFCPFAAFALVVLLANMALFRILRGFLAWFGVVVWV